MDFPIETYGFLYGSYGFPIQITSISASPAGRQDVRGETALLHFLASTSLQRGDRKGQEAQRFQARLRPKKRAGK